MYQERQFDFHKRDKKNQVEYIVVETLKLTDFENKKIPLRENTTT